MTTPTYTATPRIRDMHERRERPRERLLAYGPSALLNAELLAILLCINH